MQQDKSTVCYSRVFHVIAWFRWRCIRLLEIGAHTLPTSMMKGKVDKNGNVVEASLEETYFYKIDKPAGFAIQQVYDDDRTLDEIAVARNNDIVLVPKGYHPVVAGHGFNVYYLNFLTGSDQSLANTPDPNHEWIFNSWKSKDPRIPMVTADMNG